MMEEEDKYQGENVKFTWSDEPHEDHGHIVKVEYEKQDEIMYMMQDGGLVLHLTDEGLDDLKETTEEWEDGITRSALQFPEPELEVILKMMEMLIHLKEGEDPSETLEEEMANWDTSGKEEE